MQYTRVKRRPPQREEAAAVYANLEDLVRLQFKARGFSFLPQQPVHSLLSGRHASRLRGRGLNFEELRSYVPGDDIRTMDWKVTARTREPHVRVYTEERDRPVWLLVDQRMSMFFGSQGKMKSVLAAEAAALSAWRVLSVGDRVGGVVFSDDGIDLLTPHRSEAQVMQLLSRILARNHALNVHRGAPDPGGLNKALKAVEARARHDCLIVLITDGFGINEETRKRVSRLTGHNDVISILVYDPMERELGDAGRLVFSDLDGQIDIDTGSRPLQEAFRNGFDERLEALQNTSKRYAVPVLPLHTGEGVAEQVRDLIGKHRQPRRR